jgi:hypothetical protein
MMIFEELTSSGGRKAAFFRLPRWTATSACEGARSTYVSKRSSE